MPAGLGIAVPSGGASGGMASSPRPSSRAAADDPLGIVRQAAEFPPWLTARESFKKQMRSAFGSIEPKQQEGFDAATEQEDGVMENGGALQLTRDLPLAAVDVIKALTHPQPRSHSDQLKVYRFLLAQPFFLDADKAKMELLAERASYAYFPPGARIIRQGDHGDYFYMLLKGRVDVSVANVGWVDSMQEPASFGDLALTSDEARQASVHASADGAVHVVRISRDDFKDVMKGWREKQHEDVCDFLAQLPMFARWSRTRLMRLVGRIQVKNPRVGEVLVQQGKAPAAVYILRKGVMAVRKSTEQPHENRWPASNEAVEQALENAERLGLRRTGKGQVVFHEPEGGAGGGVGGRGRLLLAGGQQLQRQEGRSQPQQPVAELALGQQLQLQQLLLLLLPAAAQPQQPWSWQ